MKTTDLEHLYTIAGLANLLLQRRDLLERLARCKCCPPYVWRPAWPEPRWAPSTIPEWCRIIDTVPLDGLPLNPPPLERPHDVIEDPGPTAAELDTAARMLGLGACNG